MEINSKRLHQRFYQMAEIGKTEKKGVSRLALTKEDRVGRELFIKWLKKLKLNIRVDDFGNIFARKEGSNPSLPPVVFGSHLDSVPNGGKFDGTLGVLAAVEVVETICENNIQHDFPLEIVMFTNEEGARYTQPMLGSGAITGVLQKEYVYQLKDDNGIAFIDALKEIGYLGNQENRVSKVKAFIELHIEQGPVLFDKGATIGIVKGIQGISWQKVTFAGQADHAGPTPMAQRKDAFVSAIKAMDKIHRWVSKLKDETSVTFGKCSVSPNVVNVVPGQVTFTVDLRHPNKKILNQRVDKVKEIILTIASHTETEEQIEEISFMEPVLFSERLVKEIENICDENGYSYHAMFSGAGHDAMYMNRLGETVMIFVPSVDGKSHCEEEESLWKDIYQGTDLLFQLVCKEIGAYSYDFK
ncbi:Zn-dependent hydrolase [Neobacillus mesonae]|uniref:Peptidase M20 dimerisation domain-containing protein n=1 Tax=Neobacillus mesonae TaxID=1193713 RepID=A0A3T0HZT6_9BACI|nr:Zn-dependent hydrolase [Neobacillus mesonae]AZU62552.1 hypothetical protein CHR53_15435 [Neobacillus mesonae]